MHTCLVDRLSANIGFLFVRLLLVLVGPPHCLLALASEPLLCLRWPGPSAVYLQRFIDSMRALMLLAVQRLHAVDFSAFAALHRCVLLSRCCCCC